MFNFLQIPASFTLREFNECKHVNSSNNTEYKILVIIIDIFITTDTLLMY